MSVEKKVKVAVIGLGRMGKIHLRHLMQRLNNTEVVAVADAFYKRENFEKEYGKVFFTSSPDEAMDQPGVEAVVICTPTSSHAELVEKAIDKGKHIFCEKPLDLALDITERVLAKAKKTSTVLMLGFNRRFDPEFVQAKKAIADGKIGNPQIIKITNRDPGLPSIEFIKTSGGMFMDFTIHDFDMIRFMMGKEVTEVFAKGLVFFDEAVGQAGDIDTALTTVTFEDGTYAVIDNSRKAVYGYDQRMEIFGDKGMIQVDNNVYHRNVVFDATGVHSALPLNSFPERYTGSYLKELEAFIDALVNKTPLPIKNRDIVMATALAYAAKKSMDEKRPVKITEIEVGDW